MHVLSLIEMVWINDIEANHREEKLNKISVLFNISNISLRQKWGYFKIEWKLLLESRASQTCLRRQKRFRRDLNNFTHFAQIFLLI